MAINTSKFNEEFQSDCVRICSNMDYATRQKYQTELFEDFKKCCHGYVKFPWLLV
jgi:hypothetical protein